MISKLKKNIIREGWLARMRSSKFIDEAQMNILNSLLVERSSNITILFFDGEPFVLFVQQSLKALVDN